MNLFYAEGDPDKKVVPDVFVVRGLAALPEPSYRIWEAGRPPGFVLEVASPSNEELDRGEKLALYASIGVAEYCRFNPVGKLEGGPRPGARLEGGALAGLGYKPLPRDADGSSGSEVVGLDVRVDERPGKEHLLRRLRRDATPSPKSLVSTRGLRGLRQMARYPERMKVRSASPSHGVATESSPTPNRNRQAGCSGLVAQ